jgi:hypothetical protein
MILMMISWWRNDRSGIKEIDTKHTRNETTGHTEFHVASLISSLSQITQARRVISEAAAHNQVSRGRITTARKIPAGRDAVYLILGMV